MLREPKSIEELDYFTNRTFYDENGKKVGYVKVWVFKGEKIANVKYKCPYCGFEGELQKEWKRPFRFRCQNCGKSIKVPRLKK